MISKRAIAWSVALHVLLVVVLTVSVDFAPDAIRRPAAEQEIVQATVVDQRAVERELQRLEQAEKAEQQAREREARELEARRAAEEKRLAELKAEQQRLKKAESEAAAKKQEAEQKAKEAERRAAEAEKRKAEAEREKAAAEQARREAEKKKQAEAEAARKRAEAEAREAERKRIEQALQDEIAAEEAARQAAAQAEADASGINRYVAAIAARVRQSFTILPGLDGLSCTLRITLIPGGEVAGVQIVRSSGNPTFDRQAENAVRKAAPLPVPTEPRLFEQMRSITFVFDPS